MKSVILKFVLVLTLALIAVVAFAQVTLPPTVDAQFDYLKFIQELIANPKACLSIGGVALAVFFTVQLLKKYGFKFMKTQVQFLVITVLGIFYSMLVQKILGGDAVTITSLVIGFAGSAQASTLWSAIKLVFPKLLDFLGEKK